MSRSLLGINRIGLAAMLHDLVFRLSPRRVTPDRVNSTLCKQSGIAAVEDIEVMTISSAGARISAFVRLTADSPDPDGVVRCAAESLRKELRADEVILGYRDDLGRRRGVLVAGLS